MRQLVRALLVIVLIVVAGVLLLNFAGSRTATPRGTPPPGAVGTTGGVDIQRARERGAEIGEKAAVATRKVGEAVNDATLTSKIKAKMALDDSVKARAIDVTTDGSTVTLSGTVGSVAERERAVALARETAGVTRVVDTLQIRQP